MTTDLIDRLAAYRRVLDDAIDADLAARQRPEHHRPGSRRILALLGAVALVVAGIGALAWTRSDDSVPASSSTLVDQPVVTVGDTQPDTTPTTSLADTPQPTTTPAPIVGSNRWAIGDAIMLGAAAELSGDGFAVDAVESRQFRAGTAVVDSIRQRGQLGQIVVVHLGTNGTFDETAITELMELLADVPQVVLLTSDVPHDYTAGNNQLMYDAAARYANVSVLDWAGLNDHCPGECFYDDDIHLRPDGQRYYADLIDSVIRDEYVVQDGDYPLLVAQKLCTTLDELVTANNWTSPNDLPFPGDVIVAPQPTGNHTCPEPTS